MQNEPQYFGPVERLAYLKTLPLLGTLPSRDLAIVAEYAEECRFRAGDVLIEEGHPVDAIHVLVDGDVAVSREGTEFRVFHRRDSVGVVALLARTEGGVRAVAQTAGWSLRLRGQVLFDLFDEHFRIYLHVLEGIAQALRTERRKIAGDAGYSNEITESVVCPARRLDFVERMLLLTHMAPFATTNLVGLSQLARRVSEVRVEAGQPLWGIGDPPDRGYLLVCGSVECEAPGHHFWFGAADAVGVLDLLCAEPHWYGAVCSEPVVGLVFDREGLLDTLEDHSEMAVEFIAVVAAALLDVFDRRAKASPDVPEGLPRTH